MRLSRVATAFLAFSLLSATAYAEPPPLDTAKRGQIIDALVRQLNEHYVFPEVAVKIGTVLRAKQQGGSYDQGAARLRHSHVAIDLWTPGR